MIKQHLETKYLQEFLMGVHTFNAANPLNKILAALGLAVDAGDIMLNPDYVTSVEEVNVSLVHLLFPVI
jgi:hypothetical protein